MKERVEQVFDPMYNIKRVTENARKKVRILFVFVDFELPNSFVNFLAINLPILDKVYFLRQL